MISKRVPPRRQSAKKAKGATARLVKYIVNAVGQEDPRSWERTADYILDTQAEKNGSGEKVSAVRITNCGTDDPAVATQLIMATQNQNTRSKSEKTYHLVFSFPPGEIPSQEVINDCEDELVKAIGLEKHQRISAVHVNTDHLHVHVAINKVDPETYRNVEPYYDKRKRSAACDKLEEKHGLSKTDHGFNKTRNKEIYNEQRSESELGRGTDGGRTGNGNAGYEPRDGRNNGRSRRYGTIGRFSSVPSSSSHTTEFQRILHKSCNRAIERARQAAKEHGLCSLSGCRMVSISERSSLLLHDNSLNRTFGGRAGNNSILRREGYGYSGERSGGIGAEAKNIEKQTGIETLASYVSDRLSDEVKQAKTWQEVHKAFAVHGLSIKRKGAGLVFGDKKLDLWVRASQCDRSLSFGALKGRLGQFEEGSAKVKASSSYSERPAYQHISSANLFSQWKKEQDGLKQKRSYLLAAIRDDNAAYKKKLSGWKKRRLDGIRFSARGAVKKLMVASVKNSAAKASRINAQNISARRAAAYESTQRVPWAEWLVNKAQLGDTEALAVLRSREERRQKMQGDLLTAKRADKARDVIFKGVRPTINKEGVARYKTLDGGILSDEKSDVRMIKNSAGASLLAVTLAAEKFKGQKLVVSGSEEFKKELAYLTGLHGVDVVFEDEGMEQHRQEAVKDILAERERKEKIRAAFKPKEQSEQAPISVPEEVAEWVGKRNLSRQDNKDIPTHRLWEKSDAGLVNFGGKREVSPNVFVILLEKDGEMLVKPASKKQANWLSVNYKVGQPLTIDQKGKISDNIKRSTKDNEIEI